MVVTTEKICNLFEKLFFINNSYHSACCILGPWMHRRVCWKICERWNGSCTATTSIARVYRASLHCFVVTDLPFLRTCLSLHSPKHSAGVYSNHYTGCTLSSNTNETNGSESVQSIVALCCSYSLVFAFTFDEHSNLSEIYATREFFEHVTLLVENYCVGLLEFFSNF